MYPRFHTEVQEELEKNTPELIDLSIEVSIKLKKVVEALRDTAKAVLFELRSCTKSVDFSEVFIRGSKGKEIVSNFAYVINQQIQESVVDKKGEFSQRAKRLAGDLKVIQDMIGNAFVLNCVAFYQRFLLLQHTDPLSAGWLIRRDAQRALAVARSRVYTRRRKKGEVEKEKEKEKEKRGKVKDVDIRKMVKGTKVRNGGNKENNNKDEGKTEIVPVLEPSMKWTVLQQVLKEAEDAESKTVLVVAKEKSSINELRHVLTQGPQTFLKRRFLRSFRSMKIDFDDLSLTDDLRAGISASIGKNERECNSNDVGELSEGESDDEATSANEIDEYFGEVGLNSTKVILWGLDRADSEGRMRRMLAELCPEVIVMYDYDMCFIRQVEVYQAENKKSDLQLYLLIYDDDADEMLVRVSGEREKAAFKSLIRHRATMVIHVDEEDKDDSQKKIEGGEIAKSGYEDIDNGESNPQSTVQRYQGTDWDLQRASTLSRASKARTIVLDTRELRGSIPMALFSSGIKIVPITLEVGDFILTPRTAVERKTIPDLYGSFTSGRLFNQAEALSQHYINPCLLIEFDSEKRISLMATESYNTSNSELQNNSILIKLILLIRRFPNLRLLWARGAKEAAELLVSIKGFAEEPNVEEAAKHGVDNNAEGEELYNPGPRALLRDLPGIDGKNIVSVMKKVKNVAQLLRMSVEDMCETLGSQKKGRLLWEFVNENPPEALGVAD